MIRYLMMFCLLVTPLTAQTVAVRSDPRIELLTVIFRLAGAEEYDQCQVPAYAAAIDSAFGRYRGHPAIALAKRIREEHGIGFDAVPEFALSLTPPPALAERVPFDSARWSKLDGRWAGEHFLEFERSVRQFARDTRFMEFYSREQALFRAATASLQEVVRDRIHLAWFSGFFGPRVNSAFFAIPGMCNGGANYGPHVDLPGGRTEFYAVIGVSDTTAAGQPLVKSEIAPVIVHEFAHSYVNPLIAKHYAEMEASSAAIYSLVARAMGRQAYNDGRTLLNESLVRAAVVRYRRANEGTAAAEAELREQLGRSFLWIRGLDSTLARYEGARARYPTFDAFMPEVVRFFNDVAATMPDRMRQFDAARPRLIRITPADSAASVDPATATVLLVFNRPMSGGVSFNRVSGRTFPELTTHAWNAAHTELTFGVRLKPGQEYDALITGAGFQSADGVPMAERPWHFRTGP